jgi:hypothetical protein
MKGIIEEKGQGWIAFPKVRRVHYYLGGGVGDLNYISLCRWHSFISKPENPGDDPEKAHCKWCEKHLKEFLELDKAIEGYKCQR